MGEWSHTGLSVPTMPQLRAPSVCGGRGCTSNLGSLHGNSLQGREGVEGKSGSTEDHHSMSSTLCTCCREQSQGQEKGQYPLLHPHPTTTITSLIPPVVRLCFSSWADGQGLVAHPAALPAPGMQESSLRKKKNQKNFPLPGIDQQEAHVQ